VEFSTILRTSSGKSDVDDLPRPRMRTNNRSMLLAGHFTLPIVAGTSVASNGIEEWAAPANRSVAKHHYMPIVGFHAIQKFRARQIESVSNHDCCCAHVPENYSRFRRKCRQSRRSFTPTPLALLASVNSLLASSRCVIYRRFLNRLSHVEFRPFIRFQANELHIHSRRNSEVHIKKCRP
jgi:hypothetical protein